jgi:predicted PurR-regulated permease PerM
MGGKTVNKKWGRDSFKSSAVFVAVLLCVVILFNHLLGNFDSIRQTVSLFFKAISGIVIGCVIAFLLCPIMNFFKRILTRRLRRLLGAKRTTQAETWGNGLAVMCSILFFVLIIVGLLCILIPELQSSIAKLYSNIPAYIDTLKRMIDNLPVNNENIDQLVNKYLTNFETTLTNIIKDTLMPNLDSIIAKVSSGVMGGIKFIINLFVGIIVAVYILATKDQLAAQGKKIIYCLFSKKTGNIVLDALDSVNSIFGGFINGKIIDSLIIGVICAVFCTAVKMPYAVLISVVVGITNIVPVFGPFIGAIPSALLVLVEDPSMCLMFIIFIILLQQIDGNVIGPLILGDSTGLSGLWIMFAILAGGNLFGLAGMILGVPIFACLYTFVAVLIGHKLQKKGLTSDTEYYLTLRRFDEETGEPLRGDRPKRLRPHRRKNAPESENTLHQARARMIQKLGLRSTSKASAQEPEAAPSPTDEPTETAASDKPDPKA